MADRYWVGGSDTWNATAGTKWSATSGGAGGETVPTTADDVYIDANSGAVTVTIGASYATKSLDFTGFTGTFTGAGNGNIAGSLTFSATMTRTHAGAFNFTGAGSNTITTNGIVLFNTTSFNNAAGTWTLQDDLINGTSRVTTLTAGTLNLNGKTFTFGPFTSNNANVRSLLLNGGTLNVFVGFTATNATNFTTDTVGVISMNSASAKTFDGGGISYPTLNQGGAGALTIVGANTFADVTNTVEPATITFPASTTTTVGAFNVSGTPGNQITINSSTAGTQATLSDASGVNSVSYATIEDINATGGATWNAYTVQGNIDAGNNDGWDFIVQRGQYIYTRRKNKRILIL